MASYSVAEFEALLAREYELTKTESRTETAVFWKTPGGQHIMVPILADGEIYREWHVEPIERGLNRMKQNPKTRG